ncbi:MAG: 2-oxoacid:ferredoxin oxidoreductase subunit beta [Deltaproteobacteria bacterium]
MAETAPEKLTRKDFVSDQDVRWCPGCGDYGILAQVQKVMPELDVPREKMVFVSGIGCSSRFPYYMNTYGFHGIHGRAPAIASGLKLARPELTVWVVTGDGDGLSIGGNHLIHILRRNLDVNILLFNNEVYGLTKGQFSPTSRLGQITKSSPQGVVDHPFDAASVALGAGATFVARTVDVEQKHLQSVIRRAAAHRGTSFVEILQNCPVYNDGPFASITDKGERTQNQLVLEQGAPLRFGPDGGLGIRLTKEMEPEVVSVVDTGEDELLVHDEGNRALASFLARLERPDFPVPLGVLHCRERDVYEDLVYAQLGEAEGKGPDGKESGQAELFDSLFASGDTWAVE